VVTFFSLETYKTVEGEDLVFKRVAVEEFATASAQSVQHENKNGFGLLTKVLYQHFL